MELRCSQTTKRIAEKIFLLRKANKLTQEQFAEKLGLDRHTIARAEEGKHRLSPETLELIAMTWDIPASYFYDDSTFRVDISKTGLIHKINKKLKLLSKADLNKVDKLLDIIKS